MPYTLAHPITAVVLDRLFPRRLQLTGLLIGSVVPDYYNFLMLKPAESSYGHSLLGFIQVGLPLSIALTLILQFVILDSLLYHLPLPLGKLAFLHRDRFIISWNSLKDWILLVVSIGLGFASHLFLDGFTHADGLMYPYAVEVGEWLAPRGWPVGRLLQYVSSVVLIFIEVLILTWLLLKHNRSRVAVPTATTLRKALYWAVVLLCASGTTAFSLHWNHSRHLGRIIGILFVAPWTGLCLGLLLASMVFGKKANSAARSSMQGPLSRVNPTDH